MHPKMVVSIVLAALCVACGACWASDQEEPLGERPRVRGAVWILPPAYEFPVSHRGHLSLEIGATPALWPQGARSHDVFGPRVGAYVYPAGKMEGLSLYAGLGEVGVELGLWGVWRERPKNGSSGGGSAACFRFGIGVVVSGSVDWVPVGEPAVGASVGFSF